VFLIRYYFRQPIGVFVLSLDVSKKF